MRWQKDVAGGTITAADGTSFNLFRYPLFLFFIFLADAVRQSLAEMARTNSLQTARKQDSFVPIRSSLPAWHDVLGNLLAMYLSFTRDFERHLDQTVDRH